MTSNAAHVGDDVTVLRTGSTNFGVVCGNPNCHGHPSDSRKRVVRARRRRCVCPRCLLKAANDGRHLSEKMAAGVVTRGWKNFVNAGDRLLSPSALTSTSTGLCEIRSTPPELRLDSLRPESRIAGRTEWKGGQMTSRRRRRSRLRRDCRVSDARASGGRIRF